MFCFDISKVGNKNEMVKRNNSADVAPMEAASFFWARRRSAAEPTEHKKDTADSGTQYPIPTQHLAPKHKKGGKGNQSFPPNKPKSNKL